MASAGPFGSSACALAAQPAGSSQVPAAGARLSGQVMDAVDVSGCNQGTASRRGSTPLGRGQGSARSTLRGANWGEGVAAECAILVVPWGAQAVAGARDAAGHAGPSKAVPQGSEHSASMHSTQDTGRGTAEAGGLAGEKLQGGCQATVGAHPRAHWRTLRRGCLELDAPSLLSSAMLERPVLLWLPACVPPVVGWQQAPQVVPVQALAEPLPPVSHGLREGTGGTEVSMCSSW